VSTSGHRHAFSLVEVLIACVLLVALAAVLVPRLAGGKKQRPGAATAPQPQERATEVQCGANLRQIRSALQLAMQAAEEDARPRALAELCPYGVSEALTRCPATGSPYAFDHATPSVHCTYPPHQRL
jgi:cell division septation protein DedD